MISVIVPVYNIEQYIQRCLDSILAQTYSDLEIILVDDGSTDSSGSICDQYAQKDSRVIVCHQENKGVSEARNKGMDIANGEYIGFVDGDDLIDKDMFRVLHKNAVEHQCEISCCQIITIETDDSVSCPYERKTKLFNSDELAQGFFFDSFIKDIMYSQCNKIFDTNILKKVRYKKYKYGEDILFVFETITLANRIYYDDFVGYYYLHRNNSAMRKKFDIQRLDYIDAARTIENICEKKYPFAVNDAHFWVYQHVLTAIRNFLAYDLGNQNSERILKEKEYLKNNFRKYSKRLTIKRRLDYFGVIYFTPYIKMLSWLKGKIK